MGASVVIVSCSSYYFGFKVEVYALPILTDGGKWGLFMGSKLFTHSSDMSSFSVSKTSTSPSVVHRLMDYIIDLKQIHRTHVHNTYYSKQVQCLHTKIPSEVLENLSSNGIFTHFAHPC